VSAKDLAKLQKAHIICLKHIQGLRVSTSTYFSLVTVNSVPLETIADCNKLKFFGQLCRLCPWLMVKDIFLNRLIRFNNFDQQSVGFIPDICRIAQNNDLTDYILTYIESADFPSKFQWKRSLTKILQSGHKIICLRGFNPVTNGTLLSTLLSVKKEQII